MREAEDLRQDVRAVETLVAVAGVAGGGSDEADAVEHEAVRRIARGHVRV